MASSISSEPSVGFTRLRLENDKLSVPFAAILLLHKGFVATVFAHVGGNLVQLGASELF